MVAYFFLNYICINNKIKRMKKLLSIACLFITAITAAQSTSKISLKKGQSITATSTANTESELSMGTTKNDISLTNVMNVLDEKGNSYIVTVTATKMKMEMEGMGQNISFDSDKKEDKESEIGQSVAGKLNVTDTFELDKSTGKLTLINLKKTEEESNMSAGMSMMSGGGEDQPFNGAFLIVPSNKKTGDSWEETITNKGLTTKKTYTIKSIEKSIATIELTGTTIGTIEQEMQGMTMNITMDSKFKGSVKADITTGTVIESTNNQDSNNSMDVMGQQMQVTSKSNSTTLFTVK